MRYTMENLIDLIDLTQPPAFAPTGLMLERISPRQAYVVGSATSALGLGYLSLAIGKVRTITVRSDHRRFRSLHSFSEDVKYNHTRVTYITPWLCREPCAKTAGVVSRFVGPIDACHKSKAVPSTQFCVVLG